MSNEQNALADRVAALEARVAGLASYLQSALEYLSSDPASSLTKSRVILEKVLLAIYRGAMKKEPSRPMIGDMLADKAFMATIPRRIAARMNAIRDMSNLGPHGEEVDAADAIRVMRDLIDVLSTLVRSVCSMRWPKPAFAENRRTFEAGSSAAASCKGPTRCTTVVLHGGPDSK